MLSYKIAMWVSSRKPNRESIEFLFIKAETVTIILYINKIQHNRNDLTKNKKNLKTFW